MAAASQKHHHHQSPPYIVEGSEPPQMSVVFAAGAGLTGYRLFLASATCSTSLHRSPQTADDSGNRRLHAQLSLDLGSEGGDFLGIARILKAV